MFSKYYRTILVWLGSITGIDGEECAAWAWVRPSKGQCRCCSCPMPKPAASSPQMHQPSPPATAAPSASPVKIPFHGWSTEEIKAASELLDGEAWPTFTNIYAHVKDGNLEASDTNTLLNKARILQLTMQMAKRDERFGRLATLMEAGQKGMENLIWTDEHFDGKFNQYYEKTAGDMLQSC